MISRIDLSLQKSKTMEKEITDIHCKLSNIELTLAKLAADVAASMSQSSTKVPESTDCRTDGEGDTVGKTPHGNRSYSPFLSPDGELMVSSHISTTKRKLQVNEEGEEGEEVEEKHFAGFDVESFDIRNIRFTEPQFPPGLETLQDLKEDEEKAKDKKTKDKVRSPDIKVLTPKPKEITTKEIINEFHSISVNNFRDQ